MKRFAVAFIYNREMPKFDKVVCNGTNYDYYYKNLIVISVPILADGSYCFLEESVGIEIVDAMDSNEAISKTIDAIPFKISQLTAKEI